MQQSDQQRSEPGTATGIRSRRVRRAALAVALGGGLALGVGGLAYAADGSTAPSAPAAAPSGAAPSGPAGAAPSGPAGAAPAAPDPAKAHKPHLDGTVKEIGSGKILITDREGFTRQINTTTVPDGVKVGTRIHAEGTVNADGVSLDATTVAIAPDRGPGAGPGGPGGNGRPGGPGGPGGKHEERGLDSSGAPAPGASGAPAAPDASGAPDASAPPVPAPSGSAAPEPSATS